MSTFRNACKEIDHTADRAFRVQGRNFSELLENAARAMSSLDRLGLSERGGVVEERQPASRDVSGPRMGAGQCLETPLGNALRAQRLHASEKHFRSILHALSLLCSTVHLPPPETHRHSHHLPNDFRLLGMLKSANRNG